MIPDEASCEKVRLALKKVTKFVDSPKGVEFPQTSTTFQWYELEEFEAYRLLGYLMGWAYLANVQFNDRTDPGCDLPIALKSPSELFPESFQGTVAPNDDNYAADNVSDYDGNGLKNFGLANDGKSSSAADRRKCVRVGLDPQE